MNSDTVATPKRTALGRKHVVLELSGSNDCVKYEMNGSGTLGILPFMAKWTLGRPILDGRRWDVGGVTTFCGRDWTGLHSCRMLRAQ